MPFADKRAGILNNIRYYDNGKPYELQYLSGEGGYLIYYREDGTPILMLNMANGEMSAWKRSGETVSTDSVKAEMQPIKALSRRNSQYMNSLPGAQP